MLKIIKKILKVPSIIVKFLRNVVTELKQVEWLSRRKTIRYSLLVLASLVIATVSVLLVDQLFIFVRNLILQFN